MKRRFLRIAERAAACDQLFTAFFVLRCNGATEDQARRIVARMHATVIVL